MVGGKPYYLAGFVPILLAAGAQPFIDRVRSWEPPTLLVLSLPGVVFALPVLPVSASGPVIAVNPEQGETVGWRSLADQVEAVLPPGHVVLTGNYGEAGAVQRYTDLPVFSGHNGYGLWDQPPGSTPALLVELAPLVPHLCAESALVGRIEMPVGNDEDQASLYTCTPQRPWAELWPRIRFLG